MFDSSLKLTLANDCGFCLILKSLCHRSLLVCYKKVLAIIISFDLGPFYPWQSAKLQKIAADLNKDKLNDTDEYWSGLRSPKITGIDEPSTDEKMPPLPPGFL
uniref:Uncharacterized protein n=1 Tax=Romanomermis culicivorax TaxID=13658 RepID=A0A915L5U5_ROMCU